MQISFYISYTYINSFVYVVKVWPLLNLNYFLHTQIVVLNVLGILGRLLTRFVDRQKVFVYASVHLFASMVAEKNTDGDDFDFVAYPHHRPRNPCAGLRPYYSFS